MIKYFTLVLFSQLIFNVFAGNRINYTDPSDGAKYINIENNITLGFENTLTCTEKDLPGCIKVTGSSGRSYSGKLILLPGSKKIIFSPGINYLPGETITVSINGKLLRSLSHKSKNVLSFETSRVKPVWNPLQGIQNEFEGDISGYENPVISDPLTLPVMTVTINNNPEPGFLFLSNIRFGGQYTPYLIITDKNAVPYSYLQLNANGMDFKKQPNGNLTYFSVGKSKFYELSPAFILLDSFYCGNGYRTDQHELQVLPNHHAFLMSYDVQVVNMSLIVPGGDTAANVTGLVLQEIDENKNVVFQWRSWDHFLITDALHENLLAHNIDAVHCNAIELDNDGNIMISSRHLDEITKINRATGAIIWRMGGLNNQFTFINDPIRFTYQHAIRRISNGNITIYDNGNFHSPKVSRAVEYSLNEVTKTAAQVWEFKNTPAIYGSAMGNVQRLPGGNTLISWGTTNPTVTEVTPAGTKAFQMTFPAGTYTYRVFKFPWGGPPTSSGHETGMMPKIYKLSQNYPNPFNPVTNISFDIPKASYTNITVYDILGRSVKNLVSGNYRPGSYETTFDGSNFSSGLYFCVMKSGEFFSVQKMILIK